MRNAFLTTAVLTTIRRVSLDLWLSIVITSFEITRLNSSGVNAVNTKSRHFLISLYIQGISIILFNHPHPRNLHHPIQSWMMFVLQTHIVYIWVYRKE